MHEPSSRFKGFFLKDPVLLRFSNPNLWGDHNVPRGHKGFEDHRTSHDFGVPDMFTRNPAKLQAQSLDPEPQPS